MSRFREICSICVLILLMGAEGGAQGGQTNPASQPAATIPCALPSSPAGGQQPAGNAQPAGNPGPTVNVQTGTTAPAAEKPKDPTPPAKVELYIKDLPPHKANAADIASALKGNISGVVSITALTPTKLVFVIDATPTPPAPSKDIQPIKDIIDKLVPQMAAAKPSASLSPTQSVDASVEDLPPGMGNAAEIAAKLSGYPGVVSIKEIGNTKLLLVLDKTPDPKTPDRPRNTAQLHAHIQELIAGMAQPFPHLYIVAFPLGTGKNCDILNALAKQVEGVLSVNPIGNTRLAFSLDPYIDRLNPGQETNALRRSIDGYVKDLAEPATPPLPNTERFTQRLYYIHDLNGISTLINNAYGGEVKAAAVAPDTIVLTSSLPSRGNIKRDPLMDARRTLATLDQPRPQVALSTWSIQVSADKENAIEDVEPGVNQIAKNYNDVIAASVQKGWQHLVNLLGQPGFLDSQFSDYLTRQTVATGTTCCFTVPNLYGPVTNLQDNDYGLGYSALLNPLSPDLISMLVTLASSQYPNRYAKEVLNVMENESGDPNVNRFDGSPETSCQARDRSVYRNIAPDAPPPMVLQLECVREVLNRSLFLPYAGSPSTSSLGQFRAAIADFLFHYKLMTLYPHDFHVYSAAGAAANLDAQLSPVVDAFTADLEVLEEQIQRKVKRLFDKNDITYAGSGIVSVQVIAGNQATVTTKTQNYFDATPPATLADFAAAIKGIQSDKSGTPVLPQLLTSNITANEAAAALAAVQTITRTPVSAAIGKGLTLNATAYSLAGASGAEMDITVDSNENGAQLVTAATASNLKGQQAQTDDLASRVAQHTVTTRVRVDSMKLFKISTMESVLARGKSPWKPIDPWLQIPLLGELIKVPRKPALIYHRSFVFVTALIVPTAADLGNSNPLQEDLVYDPNTTVYHRARELKQLGGQFESDHIWPYHQGFVNWLSHQYIGAANGAISKPGNPPNFQGLAKEPE